MASDRQNYIFYGTLRDPDVQKILFGASLTKKYWRTQRISGYSLFFVQGTAYPGIKANKSGSFEADLYLDLSANEQAILQAYEAEEYYLETWQIDNKHFQIFFPIPQLSLSSVEWQLQDFQKSLKSSYLMMLMGQAAEVLK